MEETREVGDIMMYHFSKNHWSSTCLAGDFLLFLAVDDVMNLSVITHIEAVKHLNVLTISTTYDIPAFIEEHSN